MGPTTRPAAFSASSSPCSGSGSAVCGNGGYSTASRRHASSTASVRFMPSARSSLTISSFRFDASAHRPSRRNVRSTRSSTHSSHMLLLPTLTSVRVSMRRKVYTGYHGRSTPGGWFNFRRQRGFARLGLRLVLLCRCALQVSRREADRESSFLFGSSRTPATCPSSRSLSCSGTSPFVRRLDKKSPPGTMWFAVGSRIPAQKQAPRDTNSEFRCQRSVFRACECIFVCRRR